MDKILRVETLFGTVTKVLDASHIVKEKTTNQGVKIFKLSSIIKEKNIFIGFGRPCLFNLFALDFFYTIMNNIQN